MKKNVKKLLLGVLVGAMSVFAVVASGCSAGDKLDTWYNQLTCEHAKVEKVVGKDATCTEDGYTEHEVCKDCDKELGKKVIKATGHENITVIEGYAATCTTTGKTDGEYCNDCKKTVVEQKTIYALGHKRTYAKAEEVNCTTDGHTSGWICGREDCDYVYSGYELIPATGHEVDENGDCKNCDKENAVINAANVKVGDNLQGYVIRLAVSEEEFVTYLTCSSTNYTLDGFDFAIRGKDLHNISNVIGGLEIFDAGEEVITCMLITWESGSVVYSDEYIVLSESFSEITGVTVGQYANLFEFYYVGNNAS